MARLPDEPVGFRAFVDGRSATLLRAGWLLTGDWGLAEDLVQTALMAVWPRWAQLSGDPEAYVRRVMLSTFLRWKRRRWNGETPTAALAEPHSAIDVFGQVDDSSGLTAALALLPARQRAAVVLRYFLDLSEAQTAQAMGCAPGTVKSHTAKALSRLRITPGLSDLISGGGV